MANDKELPATKEATRRFTPAELDGNKVRVRARRNTKIDGVSWTKDQEGDLSLRQYLAVACQFARLGVLTLACVLIGAAAISPASAQQYSPYYLPSTNGGSTLLNGGTFKVAANTTTTCNSPITLTRYPGLCLSLGFACTGASTANYTFAFSQSADGVNWETTPSYNFLVAGNGTTPVVFTTNFPAGAASPYLRLTSIANTNASSPIMTNILVQVGRIPNRTGN